MPLAIFDLDNTLIAGDSDHAWGEFLVSRGVVDVARYRSANDAFYAAYQAGRLDIYAYQRFVLEPIVAMGMERAQSLRAEFVEACIRPLVLPAALDLVARHRAAGDTLLIVTATNRFIAEPIAELFAVDHLLATDPEEADGGYTGEIAGEPCYQGGKVVRLRAWSEAQRMSLDGASFYSDSHNDLPLLGLVDRPVAVDPDERLRQHADGAGWPICSLRGGDAASFSSPAASV
ncbi:MAG: HAD family hydrolase [Pseudomonadota bacterium]|nr:HAD family hydrolase [Pseudomonadota bacterium]